MTIKHVPGPDVDVAFGLKKSARHERVKDGLLTRAVKLSSRCARWPSNEIEEIQLADIAGADDMTIKALVTRLHAARKSMSEDA
jgi:prophage regulatory protein